MRILDATSDKTLNHIFIYLELSEAIELHDRLVDIIHSPVNNHSHISSEDYKKEITICVYDPLNISEFDDRSQRIIKDDE